MKKPSARRTLPPPGTTRVARSATPAERRSDVQAQFEISPAAAAVAWMVLAASAVVFVLAVLSVLSGVFEVEGVPEFGQNAGFFIMLSAATFGAAFWFLRTYPKWVRDQYEPGGMRSQSASGKGLPPALVAFGKVAPLFFLPTGALGLGLVLGKWTEKDWARSPAAAAAAGAAILITSVFVLVAAPRLWTRTDDRPARRPIEAIEKGAPDQSRGPATADSSARFESLLRTIAPFFAACSGLLGIAMTLGQSRAILESADRWELVLCGVSLIATAACAMSLGGKLKPHEESTPEPRGKNA